MSRPSACSNLPANEIVGIIESPAFEPSRTDQDDQGVAALERVVDLLAPWLPTGDLLDVHEDRVASELPLENIVDPGGDSSGIGPTIGEKHKGHGMCSIHGDVWAVSTSAK